MRVKVVFFAGLAQRLGVREEWLELAAGATAGEVFAHYRRREPQLGELGKAVVLAVNCEFRDAGFGLQENDEVALLPPMSGGAGATIAIQLTRERLPAAAEAAAGTGGSVVFEGITRAEGGVIALDYEAYEAMAEARLAALAREADQRWPLLQIEMAHRLGRVPAGEASVRVAVAAAHRTEAFAACRFLIDELKRSVPIWKKEIYASGESAWAAGEIPGR